jgi:hypothetical protein
MPSHDDLLIRVQSEWNGWRQAEVRLRDLQDVHWFQPGPAPHPLLHGYIACANIVAGEIPHECNPTAPHRLLVCVLKKHSLSTAFDELVRRANEAPAVLAAARSSRASTAVGDR